MSSAKKPCATLWAEVKKELLPTLEQWGFVPHPGRDIRGGYIPTIHSYSIDLIHENIYPNVCLLQIWVDCKRLSVMVDGVAIEGESKYATLSDVDESWGVGTANDFRYMRDQFRLSKTLLEIIMTGSVTYSISRKGGPEEIRERASRVVGKVKDDLEYVRSYFFEGYRG